MWQDILTWVIIAVCVGVAVGMLVRRLRGKGKSCGCGCGGTSETCTPSADACSGCAIADLCKKPDKK